MHPYQAAIWERQDADVSQNSFPLRPIHTNREGRDFLNSERPIARSVDSFGCESAAHTVDYKASS